MTIEQQAREAAWAVATKTRTAWLTEESANTFVGQFCEGFLAAAEPREKMLRELRLLAESQLTVLRELKAAVLSDTRDAEIAELRARVAELEDYININVSTETMGKELR